MLRGVRRGRARRRGGRGLEPPCRSRSRCSRATPTRRAFDARLAARARRRAATASCAAGSSSTVCAAAGLRAIVPGVRLAGAAIDDQARVGTPGDAIAPRRRLARRRPRGDACRRSRAPRRRRSPPKLAHVVDLDARTALRRASGRTRSCLGTAASYTQRRPQPHHAPARRRALGGLAHAAPALAHTRAAHRCAREGGGGPASACGGEGQAEDRTGSRCRDLFAQSDNDDMLAKLKVVSVLESLPGVGKVRARRHHGGARHHREPPAARPRRPSSAPRCSSAFAEPVGAAVSAGASCSSSPGRRAPARARSARALRARDPSLALVGLVDDAARRGRARSTASTTTSSTREEFERCATRAASSSGSRSTATSRARPASRSRPRSPRATTSCSRSTCRARWRSGSSSRRRCSCSCGRRRRDEQRARLRGRGTDDPEQIGAAWPGPRPRRPSAEQFDAVVVNDDVDRAVGEVAAILDARRTAPPSASR